MLRRRLPASVVKLITAAYLVSSLGCSTGVFRQAVMPADSAQASAVTLPSEAALADRGQATASPSIERLPAADADSVQLASYQGNDASWNEPITTGESYNDVNFDVDEVVRGQYRHPYGPVQEFIFNPYVIGAAIIAGIAIPLAVENRDTPVGG